MFLRLGSGLSGAAGAVNNCPRRHNPFLFFFFIRALLFSLHSTPPMSALDGRQRTTGRPGSPIPLPSHGLRNALFLLPAALLAPLPSAADRLLTVLTSMHQTSTSPPEFAFFKFDVSF